MIRPRAVGALVLVAFTFTGLACSSGGGSASGGASATAGDAARGKGANENTIVYKATEAEIAAAKSAEPIKADSAVLYVNGMGCPLCASNIDRQLERVKGVNTVKVDLSTGKVSLGFKPGQSHPSPAALGEAVEDAGFTLVKVEQAGAGSENGGSR